MTMDIKIDNDSNTLKLKKINEVQIDPKNFDDQVTIQVLDLIFTHNLNFS